MPDPHQAAREAEAKRRAKQEQNNAKAAEVMEKSKPVPTQEECDLLALGVPVEIENPNNPVMPSLEEQRKVDQE